MVWLIVLAIWTVAVALVVIRVVDARRTTTGAHLPSEVGVTLSVLPGGTAVITVELGADAPLVEHAVNEALAYDSIDIVEIRSPDGQLIDRRGRGEKPLARGATST